MTAYKYLIVGVTFLVLGGAGYYFNSSGGSELMVQAISSGDAVHDGVTGIEVYSGTYECTMDDGCLSSTYLILNSDTTLEISQENEVGHQTLFTGSWGIGNSGILVFIIDPVTIGTTTPGFSFVAKKVSTLTISNFSNAKKLPEGMAASVFTRIAN